MERVELHTYTVMSKMQGLNRPKELINKAKEFGMKAVAITDIASVQAFPEAQKCFAKNEEMKDFKVIYGMEGNFKIEEQGKMYHITILVRNKIGLKNLYKIVSSAYLDNFNEFPIILKNILDENREGLLIGCNQENGELTTAIEENKTEIEKIAGYYDYLEIQEPINRIQKEQTKKIIEIGERLKKVVVAVGNVHYTNPEDKKYMDILLDMQGITDITKYEKSYLKPTSEMLKNFEYLGKETAERVVIENTNKIADMCEKFEPIPTENKEILQIRKYDYEELETLAFEKAHELYGKNLPKEVQERINQELETIKKNQFEGMYMLAQRIAKGVKEEGYIIGSRGSVCASFIAKLIGITEINPLKPHYRCPLCKHSEFGKYKVKNGLDLPNKKCPRCETNLLKDGMDIPFEEFAGIDGKRKPDIDLNMQAEARKGVEVDLKSIFGKDKVLKAGTVGTCFRTISKYCREKNIKLEEEVYDRLCEMKGFVGEHPGKFIIIPQNKEIYDFTPIQKPETISKNIVTHFDYHAITDAVFDIDILTCSYLSPLYKLQELTGVNPKQIPLDDKETMKLFMRVNTLGIPEFGTKFERMLMEITEPKTFEELMKISGLSHGANAWFDNGDALIIEEGKKLSELIAFRDDIFLELQERGIPKEIAFEISEIVRKGKVSREPKWEEYVKIMKKYNVPKWYIKSCEQVRYLFPKAHAAVYVLNNYRIAWFKVHFPEQFYKVYFEENADEETMKIIKEGKEAVNAKIDEIENNKNRSYEENEMCDILEVAKEMYEREIEL